MGRRLSKTSAWSGLWKRLLIALAFIETEILLNNMEVIDQLPKKLFHSESLKEKFRFTPSSKIEINTCVSRVLKSQNNFQCYFHGILLHTTFKENCKKLSKCNVNIFLI